MGMYTSPRRKTSESEDPKERNGKINGKKTVAKSRQKLLQQKQETKSPPLFLGEGWVG